MEDGKRLDINFGKEIEKHSPTTKSRVAEKIAMAALGSIPWVGAILTSAASYKMEEGNLKAASLQRQWLEEHDKKLQTLSDTLNYIWDRINKFGEDGEKRADSEEYLNLVKKGFRIWDESDTDEKRKYISNLLANAAGHKLCTDDVIRLFMDWLKIYHELHFAIIKVIYNETGITRFEMWSELRDKNLPREDSPEADLFKFIIRELSTGGVIRQVRNTTADGRFLKRKPQGRGFRSSTMESAFDDTKGYILTELGKQFVHYTMSEVVTRIDKQ